MSEDRSEWSRARDGLMEVIVELGFPEELGILIAQELGSPQAIRRMTAYLRYARPDTAEDVADEMLAIRDEIRNWKDRKASEEANSDYNAMLLNGLDP
jgi:hypothetical protein